MWKKGYFTNKDSLPSLHNFEINVLLAKFFFFRKNQSPQNLKIISFINETIRNYLEKYEMLEQSFSVVQQSSNLLILEEELDKEFREKNFKEKQTALLFMHDLFTEHFFPYLTKFTFEDYPDLPEYDSLIMTLIDYLPKSDVVGFMKFKCIDCNKCKECEKKMSKLKKQTGIEEVLKKLVILQTKNKDHK